MRRHGVLIHWIGLAAVLLCALEARGQTWLTFEEIERGDVQAGDTVQVAGRYVELEDDRISLLRSPAKFQVANQAVLRKVLELETDNETLILKAECLSPSGLEILFRVDSVTPGPALEELFRKELGKLKSLDSGKAEVLFAFAKRIYSTADELDSPDSVREIGREACRAAIAERDAELAADDVATRLAVVGSIQKWLDDDGFVRELLIDLDQRYPKADEVRAALIGMNCRKYQGKWLTHAEFKETQGFVTHQGRWVHRHEEALLKTIDLYKERPGLTILRRRLDREYQLLAQRGQVEIGMRAEEVYEALGFPDRVYRRLVRDRDGSAKVLSQWVYEGEQFYYLLDGLILRTPDNDSELR